MARMDIGDSKTLNRRAKILDTDHKGKIGKIVELNIAGCAGDLWKIRFDDGIEEWFYENEFRLLGYPKRFNDTWFWLLWYRFTFMQGNTLKSAWKNLIIEKRF